MASERLLGLAAASFAAADVYGSLVALRQDVPGEPFGVSVPLAVPAGLWWGWGAGVAAPWPMPVAAMAAATVGDRSSAVPAFVAAGIGLGCIAGTLVEPVTYHRRAWTPAIRRAIGINLVTAMALVATGLRSAAARR